MSPLEKMRADALKNIAAMKDDELSQLAARGERASLLLKVAIAMVGDASADIMRLFADALIVLTTQQANPRAALLHVAEQLTITANRMPLPENPS